MTTCVCQSVSVCVSGCCVMMLLPPSPTLIFISGLIVVATAGQHGKEHDKQDLTSTTWTSTSTSSTSTSTSTITTSPGYAISSTSAPLQNESRRSQAIMIQIHFPVPAAVAGAVEDVSPVGPSVVDHDAVPSVVDDLGDENMEDIPSKDTEEVPLEDSDTGSVGDNISKNMGDAPWMYMSDVPSNDVGDDPSKDVGDDPPNEVGDVPSADVVDDPAGAAGNTSLLSDVTTVHIVFSNGSSSSQLEQFLYFRGTYHFCVTESENSVDILITADNTDVSPSRQLLRRVVSRDTPRPTDPGQAPSRDTSRFPDVFINGSAVNGIADGEPVTFTDSGQFRLNISAADRFIDVIVQRVSNSTSHVIDDQQNNDSHAISSGGSAADSWSQDQPAILSLSFTRDHNSSDHRRVADRVPGKGGDTLATGLIISALVALVVIGGVVVSVRVVRRARGRREYVPV